MPREQGSHEQDLLLLTGLLRVFCVLDRGVIVVGQEGRQPGLPVTNRREGLLDFLKQLLRYGVCENDLAGLWGGRHCLGT
jgi:hypothetical protein